MFLEALQQYTFWMCLLSDPSISGLGVSTEESSQVGWIRKHWKICSVGGPPGTGLGNGIKPVVLNQLVPGLICCVQSYSMVIWCQFISKSVLWCKSKPVEKHWLRRWVCCILSTKTESTDYAFTFLFCVGGHHSLGHHPVPLHHSAFVKWSSSKEKLVQMHTLLKYAYTGVKINLTARRFCVCLLVRRVCLKHTMWSCIS